MNQFELFDEIEKLQPGAVTTFSKARWKDHYQDTPLILIPKWCSIEHSPMERRVYEIKEEMNYYKINRVS